MPLHRKHSVFPAASVAKTMYQNAVENGQARVSTSSVLYKTDVGMPEKHCGSKHISPWQIAINHHDPNNLAVKHPDPRVGPISAKYHRHVNVDMFKALPNPTRMPEKHCGSKHISPWQIAINHHDPNNLAVKHPDPNVGPISAKYHRHVAVDMFKALPNPTRMPEKHCGSKHISPWQIAINHHDPNNLAVKHPDPNVGPVNAKHHRHISVDMFKTAPEPTSADPSRRCMPLRHAVPLQRKHLVTQMIENPLATKNKYKHKFRYRRFMERKDIGNALVTSPPHGNAGKPRHSRKRQLKVNRTKPHQYPEHHSWTHVDKHQLSVNHEPKPYFKSRKKKRRSSAARIMRESNRSNKRQHRRRLYRMVRKCMAVQAPQPCTYNGAQESTQITQTPDSPTCTRKIKQIQVGNMNCMGMNHISAREKIIHMMKTHKLDILFLQETHINTNTEEMHEDYHFVFSTSVTDKQREDAMKKREEHQLRKGKGKGKGKTALELFNLDAEKLGTAVVYHKSIHAAKLDLIQHDNRNISISLRSMGGELNITGTHAPHAGRPTNEKLLYYRQLNNIALTQGRHKKHTIVGDFNAELLQRLPAETEHVGPYIFNTDDRSLEDLPQAQMENREMFV